eukprot:g446.t1
MFPFACMHRYCLSSHHQVHGDLDGSHGWRSKSADRQPLFVDWHAMRMGPPGIDFVPFFLSSDTLAHGAHADLLRGYHAQLVERLQGHAPAPASSEASKPGASVGESVGYPFAVLLDDIKVFSVLALMCLPAMLSQQLTGKDDDSLWVETNARLWERADCLAQFSDTAAFAQALLDTNGACYKRRGKRGRAGSTTYY